ncbi:MAG: glycosyltransferase [Chloroflexota bacterium]
MLLTTSAPTKLNICLPVNYLGMGGAERQLTDLAIGLDKSLFDVTVVTLESGGPLEPELAGQPGVSLHSLGRRGKLDPRPWFRLARLLKKRRVHVVQPFLTPATLYGLGAAMLARTPIRIVTERNGLRLNPGRGNHLYRFAEDRLTRFADRVVPNSEAGRRYVISRGIRSGMTQVIYNGINPSRLRPDHDRAMGIRRDAGVPEGGFLVGNVASLTPAKDQASLLQAVRPLMDDHAGLRLALVGDGPLRDRLESLAGDLGIRDKVTFFGAQRGVADFIAAFDLAALSSVDHEGCSNFLLEAMGNGKPVVTTDIGGNPELVEHGRSGWIVPAGDPAAMGAAISKILNAGPASAEIGEAGRRIVDERFSLARMVKDYEDLYQGLAALKLRHGQQRRESAA